MMVACMTDMVLLLLMVADMTVSLLMWFPVCGFTHNAPIALPIDYLIKPAVGANHSIVEE